MPIRVHGVIPESRVNGPGRRAVVHLQGCTLGCPGCFNPESHPHAGGVMRAAGELADELVRSRPEGVTVSGGEPFQQIDGLAALVASLRRRGVGSILVFSGYTLDEIEAMPRGREVVDAIDVLVAGRYDARVPAGGGLASSGNQRVHVMTPAHTAEELTAGWGEVEITIREDGTITMTGFPDARLRRAVKSLGSP